MSQKEEQTHPPSWSSTLNHTRQTHQPLAAPEPTTGAVPAQVAQKVVLVVPFKPCVSMLG